MWAVTGSKDKEAFLKLHLLKMEKYSTLKRKKWKRQCKIIALNLLFVLQTFKVLSYKPNEHFHMTKIVEQTPMSINKKKYCLNYSAYNCR